MEPWSNFKDVVALKDSDPKPEDLPTSGDPDYEVCDVNKDGIVDVADIATIIDKMAGK